MTDFIFMLTRQDRTIAEAAGPCATALACGVRHIGFKDIGLPFAALRDLAAQIRAGGATSYLEVVSRDPESERRSIEAARALGVDVVLGGTGVAAAAALLAGSGLRYMPFPGRVEGHPSRLEGSLDDIVASAVQRAAHPGVDGLDLLAWRATGDVPALIAAVCRATAKPVIVAGSIDSPAQIAALRAAGAAGFTIGTAALEGRFPAEGPGLPEQLRAIAAA
ncbi:4-hydroxythreonine-4-phosphate dehydrogenase [Pseudoroseomonas deserti]|uniref:4-hydroxythreonine-4-phosphate dehydrogenase n=1 Tax=Teichococcus deserti TaxID=1817963 RepID=A0A1V2H1T8_9PROT|nr:4-hydroxythreonine-4-phosphate dehydrogenase [Pseudoroseomonas deserti]ONG53247.1 4-hydroxythreonine-4-phosphate dehydrogenase [Pseudoroseomonas deserti]